MSPFTVELSVPNSTDVSLGSFNLEGSENRRGVYKKEKRNSEVETEEKAASSLGSMYVSSLEGKTRTEDGTEIRDQ